MKRLYALRYLLLLMFVAACVQLGLEKPDTTPQRIAYAIVAITEAREATLHLLSVKRIDPPDARKVQTLADVARISVDQARDLYYVKSDTTGALKALQSAELILNEVNQILATKAIRP